MDITIKQAAKSAEEVPSCPKWLELEAKREWKRLAKKMEELGILPEVNMIAFAGYCQAYARWKEADKFISRHGTIMKTSRGDWQTAPQVSLAQIYSKVMTKFGEEFFYGKYDYKGISHSCNYRQD